VFRGTGKIIIC